MTAMIENRTTVANILDDCARLLELAEGEVEHAYAIGYVGGRLAAAAEAVRSGDTRTLATIATVLDGKVSQVQTQKAGGE
jgi:hypothetical protein